MKDLKCLSYFRTRFLLWNEQHEGDCYVLKHDVNLLGNAWMTKVKKLRKQLAAEPPQSATVSVSPNNHTRDNHAEVKKKPRSESYLKRSCRKPPDLRDESKFRPTPWSQTKSVLQRPNTVRQRLQNSREDKVVPRSNR